MVQNNMRPVLPSSCSPPQADLIRVGYLIEHYSPLLYLIFVSCVPLTPPTVHRGAGALYPKSDTLRWTCCSTLITLFRCPNRCVGITDAAAPSDADPALHVKY